MAYYCVAHLFQGGDMYGKADSSSQPLRAEELTDEVWDFIFRGAPFPASAGFAEDSEAGEAIRKAKREFEFWYPMVSFFFSFGVSLYFILIFRERKT